MRNHFKCFTGIFNILVALLQPIRDLAIITLQCAYTQVSENIIYYYKDGKFCSYDTKAFEEKCMSNDDTLIKNIRIEKDRLFIQYTDSIKTIENISK